MSLVSSQQVDQLTQSQHKRVAEFVDKRAGIQLPDHKRTLIESRLRKLVRNAGYQKFKDYLDYALADQTAQREIIDALTTNKTDFFREPKHYGVLERYLRKNRDHFRRQTLKVWSAGCSTGEEPYTLAMVIDQLGLDFHILATDISPSVLSTAKRAVYAHHLVEPIDMDLRKKYLLKNPKTNQVKIVGNLRRHIHFEEFNLINDAFSSLDNFDLIFCRNVMIYFNQEQRAQLIKRFVNKLKEGGLFFIGHSESLPNDIELLNQIEPTVYQKDSKQKSLR